MKKVDRDLIYVSFFPDNFHSGWDCHGLPVEFEIDKLLNIRGPEDVQRMGIAAYNNECRKIVMRYSNEWERVVKRMGRWIGKNLHHFCLQSTCFRLKKMFYFAR